MDTKRCSRCGEQLPLNMFYGGYPHGDGLTPHCKRCHSVIKGKIYNGNRNKDRDAEIPEGFKFCPKCNLVKAVAEFDRCSSKSSGYQSHCKLCRRAKKREGKPEREILPEGMKRCWDCKRVLVADPTIFIRNNASSDGLSGRCRECHAVYRQINNEAIKARKRQYYAENREEINQRFKDKLANDPEFRERFRATRRKHYYENHERMLEINRQNYFRNIESRRAYNEANREIISAKRKLYYQKNRERIRKAYNEWYQENIEVARRNTAIRVSHRRRREESLPNTFSVNDWKYSLEYFDHKCAVCGKEADGQTLTLSIDHWIPISDLRPDNLGTVPENIVPLCHGVDGCNNSKRNTEPKIWLIRKLGEEAGLAKLAEIEAYFQHLRDRKLGL